MNSGRLLEKELLQATGDEEGDADRKLMRIAEADPPLGASTNRRNNTAVIICYLTDGRML
jgi:hypothetical protein